MLHSGVTRVIYTGTWNIVTKTRSGANKRDVNSEAMISSSIRSVDVSVVNGSAITLSSRKGNCRKDNPRGVLVEKTKRDRR